MCGIAGYFDLKTEEKEAIIEKFTERGDGAWSVESTQHRFNRLICTILGVLKYDAISDDWAEISHLDAERDPEDWELVSQS